MNPWIYVLIAWIAIGVISLAVSIIKNKNKKQKLIQPYLDEVQEEDIKLHELMDEMCDYEDQIEACYGYIRLSIGDVQTSFKDKLEWLQVQ